MAVDWIKLVEQDQLKKQLPDIHPGDTVKVKIRIKEGNKERLQAYEGVVINFRGTGASKTLTVRRVFQGIGVERVFLLHSPFLESIQVLRRGDVRRAKLYYMRTRSGKSARIKEKLGAALAKVQAQEQAKLDEEAVSQPAPKSEPAPKAEAAPASQEETPAAAEAPVAETAVESAPEAAPETTDSADA